MSRHRTKTSTDIAPQNASFTPEALASIGLCAGALPEQVFDTLYARYAPRMRHYLMRHSLTQEQAEDIVQDVFVNVWTILPSLKLEFVRTFLYRCCLNAATDITRRRKHPVGGALSLNAIRGTDDEAVSLEELVADTRPDSDFEQRRQDRDLIRQCIERATDERMRATMILYSLGFRLTDIAAILNEAGFTTRDGTPINPGTLKSIMRAFRFGVADLEGEWRQEPA